MMKESSIDLIRLALMIAINKSMIIILIKISVTGAIAGVVAGGVSSMIQAKKTKMVCHSYDKPIDQKTTTMPDDEKESDNNIIESNNTITDVASNTVTKAEVEDRVRGMENRFRDCMNDYRDDVQSMLYSFRTSLYESDYRQLCTSYQKLHLFGTVVLERRINKIKNDDTLSSETKDLLCKAIGEIQGSVLKRTYEMELGLEKLGLFLIRPIAGDEYNCNEHETDDDNVDMKTTVKVCKCPGIKSDVYVICKAKVEVI